MARRSRPLDQHAPEALKPSLAALCEEIASLSTRIEDVEAQLEALARQIPVVARLRSVPGIGLLSATALYAPSSATPRVFPPAVTWPASSG
jgi:transposase